MSKPGDAAVIEVAGLGKTFRRRGLFADPGVQAVADVSFTVQRNRTLGIVGESGSGKSTLLRMILRLIPPTAGSIHIDGDDIWAQHGARLKALRRKVQPIFQNPASSFNPRQSIGTILAAPLQVHGVRSAEERRGRAEALLERVGLDRTYMTRLPHQLSGGQKQRVAIARAVILGPEVLLADEPTSALDVSVQAQVLRLLDEVKREFGLTTIFVSHNLAVIQQVSDDVVVMRHGRVVESGTVDEIFDRPRTGYTRALIAAVPDPTIHHRRVVKGNLA